MNKKRILALSLITIFTLANFVGCGKSDAKNNESNEKTDVVAKEEKNDDINLDEFTVQSLSAKALSSSSVLKDGNGISYDSILVTDKSDDTAWVEGQSGDGIGEWIFMEFAEEVMVKEIRISNGYSKSSKTYYNNNRVKKLKLEFSEGTQTVINFDDGISSMQSTVLEKGVKTSSIKMSILEVYKGDKYTDTCINEVEVKGFENIKDLTDENIDELNKKQYSADIIVKKVIEKQKVEEIPITNTPIFTETTPFSKDGYVMYKGIKLPSNFEKVTDQLMEQVAKQLNYDEAWDVFKNYGYSDKAIFEYLLPYHHLEG